MSECFNPYAPPAAQVEFRDQAGAVWREGTLVAMESDGRLPSRCVRCNLEAAPQRVTRKLFWTPPLWRWSVIAVSIFLVVMALLGSPVATMLFWPIVLIAVIANAFVRKKAIIDLPVCRHHRRMDTLLALAALAGLALFITLFVWAIKTDPAVFLGLLALMLALGIAHAWSGVRTVALARVSGGHIWLKRTGAPFRISLPESPQAASAPIRPERMAGADPE